VPPPAARHRRDPRRPAAPPLGAQEDAQAFRELDADGRALFTLPAAERARLREISHADQPWFTGARPRPAAPAEAPRSLGGPLRLKPQRAGGEPQASARCATARPPPSY
jgi:hypothetical protein